MSCALGSARAFSKLNKTFQWPAAVAKCSGVRRRASRAEGSARAESRRSIPARQPITAATCSAVAPEPGAGVSRLSSLPTCPRASSKAEVERARTASCTTRRAAPKATRKTSSLATSNGSSPQKSAFCTSARALSSNFAHSARRSTAPRPEAAKCSGVWPRKLFCTFGSAPPLSSASTASTLPQMAAMCSAVWPMRLPKSGGQPAANRARTASTSLSRATVSNLS
mmetsp:Transcript_43497/g.124397  ORF Transcript_43497/g.124397 Transcript_43497/m.124397 type:complete len:225 (+) Transcript_43497:116-790(+)